jgi:hypothetical protein
VSTSLTDWHNTWVHQFTGIDPRSANPQQAQNGGSAGQPTSVGADQPAGGATSQSGPESSSGPAIATTDDGGNPVSSAGPTDESTQSASGGMMQPEQQQTSPADNGGGDGVADGTVPNNAMLGLDDDTGLEADGDAGGVGPETGDGYSDNDEGIGWGGPSDSDSISRPGYGGGADGDINYSDPDQGIGWGGPPENDLLPYQGDGFGGGGRPGDIQSNFSSDQSGSGGPDPGLNDGSSPNPTEGTPDNST